MASVEYARSIALQLPRTTTSITRGVEKFRIGRIVYLALVEAPEIMGFGYPKEERDGLIAAEPEKFLLPRASDMRYNWVHGRLPMIDEAETRELILDAWRMCVPKRLAAALDEDAIR